MHDISHIPTRERVDPIKKGGPRPPGSATAYYHKVKDDIDSTVNNNIQYIGKGHRGHRSGQSHQHGMDGQQ